MEDLNVLAADCIVISCCCECLVLQIVIFVLLKLPQKMIRKTKAFAKKRRLIHRKRSPSSPESYNNELPLPPLRVQVEEFLRDIGVHGFGDDGDEFCCMEEVEKVLEGLSQKGQFDFGSFWGRGGEFAPEAEATNCASAFRNELDVQLSLDFVASFSSY